MITSSTGTDFAESDTDDLSRDVYCILGVPVDAMEMPAVLERIESAAKHAAAFLISTPNLNFLVNSQVDPVFREALLASDLCTPDGMPIIWIARITKTPIRNRVAGSDIFLALKRAHTAAKPLKVFFFGGPEGIAAEAGRTLNQEGSGLRCVGTFYPGFGTVEEMSGDEIIRTINTSGADFLIASLGAKKGQLWLMQNQNRLQIPLRAHLGAVVSFQAGTVRRAPVLMRQYGFEWLWRIKEEPLLWKRYWNDGIALLRLLLNYVLPLVIETHIRRWKDARHAPELNVTHTREANVRIVKLAGVATSLQAEKALQVFRDAVARAEDTTIDFSETRTIDARFLGLLLMLRKALRERKATLKCTGVSPRLKRTFRLNGAAFLLSPDHRT